MAVVRPRRVVECGLEVPRGVVYQGWEPGGEYTKTLVVKNVQLRTQRIKYTIKGDQFHSAVYPRPIVLSAGMSYTLPIVFKPRKKEPCEESIELETSEGAVEISLRAVLPSVVVALPESLKFGLCAVQDSLSLDFQISNTSNASTYFSWECPRCFTVSPETGELPPKSSLNLSATFSPESALVYRGTATCTYYGREGVGEKAGLVQLKGVGKYPHVVVRAPPVSGADRACKTRGGGERREERDGGVGTEGGRGEEERGRGEEVVASRGGGRQEVVVRFGVVAVGTSGQRWIELVNVSAVTAVVSVLPSSHSRLTPAHFSCPHSPITVPPHSSHRLPLTFTPSLPSPHSLFALFEVRVQGGLSTTTVKCVGATKVPRVSIEEEVVDFGSMSVGQSATAVLHVRNDSDVTTLFQVQLEPGSVFRADCTCARLPPRSTHKIPVHFTPQRPIPHCKRVACLAQHQEPLFVYLIGTVYSETIRPVVLQPKHVRDYIANAQAGITKLPPERVAQFQGREKLTTSDTTGLVVQPHAITSDHLSATAPTRDAPILPFANYLHSQHDPSGVAHVSVDSQDLQFGFVSPQSVSDSKSVQVTNHTEETVVCVWMTESGGTFSVTPQEKEIVPGATSLFTALFSPKHAGKFYFEELECYIFYKGLQCYQSVSGAAAVTLPWCLSVRAHGHSFTANTHTFMPNLKFETRDLVFPASGPLEPAYRSMTVWNEGDTPVLFELPPDSKQIFTIKPLSGLIPKGHHQTFVMEMMPREAKTYKHITHCVLNATTNYTQVPFPNIHTTVPPSRSLCAVKQSVSQHAPYTPLPPSITHVSSTTTTTPDSAL
ncbi:Cilia- and flagella-associated protein 65 [Geodia barretti]|uniref:Cilia- and flagella-associated protein 65 n=1 Tax=Geodia barretti TaxID=519541 RepID=A0AA35X9Q3_GEOBA|nr:Cilia- and flagella-associated protein 65 [Geodia barretti]